MAEGDIVQPARRRGRPPKAKVLPPVAVVVPAEPVRAVADVAAPVAKAARKGVAKTVAKIAEKATEAAPIVTKVPRKSAKIAAETVAIEADLVTTIEQSAAESAKTNIEAAAEAADQVSSAVTETATDMVAAAETVTAEAQPPVTASIDQTFVETPAADDAAVNLKGLFTMATAPATAQALFSEINERAKGAFGKSVKASEELVEFTKGNVEALVTSARVAAKGTEALAQDAAEYGKKSFETATTAFKSFATVKSPTELFQLQSDYAKSSFDSAVAETSKLSEGMIKLLGDIFQPLSSRYAVATEKFKATAL